MSAPTDAMPETLLTPALDTRWGDATGMSDTLGRIAGACALLAHVLLIWVAAGGLDGFLAATPASQSRRPKPIGDKAGVLDGVAAEIIDAAELDKRYIAFRAGKAAADSEVAAAAAKSQPPAAAQLKTASIEPPLSPDRGEGGTPKPPQLRRIEPTEKPVLSEAEISELLASTMEDIQGGVLAVARPGGARLGEASPFTRGVIRILKQKMPRSNGLKGSVVVQLIVSETGQVEAIRLVSSSGKPALDRLVLETVGATRLIPPTPSTPPRERLFQITYDYN